MSYRILQEINTVTKERRYIVQRKSFGFWFDCQKRVGMVNTRAVFYKIKKADKFIKERVYCSSWKKEY